jgi:Flp pilus assembly protein TadG
MMLQRKTARPGTVLAETALIYPILFLIVLGVIMLGLSVFRYQQASHISREAARWASVHGEQYATEQNTTAATPQDICTNAVAPFAASMSTQGMTFTSATAAGTITYTGVSADGSVTLAVTWNTRADGVTPDKRPKRTIQVPDPITGGFKDVAQYNTVSVTVTYTWNTGLFGTIPVSSTSTNTIFY